MSNTITTDNAFTYEQLVLGGQAHTTRVLILMVMGENTDVRWSASDMTAELVERGHSLSLGSVSYHFRTLLATRWIARSGKPGRVRGAIETYYRIDGRRLRGDSRV